MRILLPTHEQKAVSIMSGIIIMVFVCVLNPHIPHVSAACCIYIMLYLSACMPVNACLHGISPPVSYRVDQGA